MKGEIICSQCENRANWTCTTCGLTYCDGCLEDGERLRCQDCGGALQIVEAETREPFDGNDDADHVAFSSDEKVNYHSRPTQVDAVQYTGDNYEEISAFTLGGAQMTQGTVYVAAIGGTLTLNKGDYVVQGAKGEYFVLKSNTFNAFFEPQPSLSS